MPEENDDPKDEKKEDPKHDKGQNPPEGEKEMSEEEMRDASINFGVFPAIFINKCPFI